MKIDWLIIIFLIISFFLIEIVIYSFLLLIKALKIYIRKNNDNNPVEPIKEAKRKSKAGVIGIAVFNIIFVAFLVAMPYIQRNNDIYNTENVIVCDQKNIDEFTKLLEDNEIQYKVIGNTKVKMQNKDDFDKAERIVQDNGIGYSIVNVLY